MKEKVFFIIMNVFDSVYKNNTYQGQLEREKGTAVLLHFFLLDQARYRRKGRIIFSLNSVSYYYPYRKNPDPGFPYQRTE